MTDLPIDVVSAASHAAAEKHGMGALHVGINVVERLVEWGYIELVEDRTNAKDPREGIYDRKN